MTIRQIAETAGCSLNTVRNIGKTIYPNIKALKSGIALDYTKEQSITIMDKLPKSNYIENPNLTNIGNPVFDMKMFADMMAISLATALKPIYDKLEYIENKQSNTKLLPAPQIQDRPMLTKLVREYAVNRLGGDFQQAYRELYSQLLYRLKTNVKVRAKNEGIKTMDYLERENLIPTCISIMIELSV